MIRKIKKILFIITFSILTIFTYGQSKDQKEENKSQPWWQIAAGIIAVPAGILGLYYTYRLSEKTRLESKKLQFELEEKASKIDVAESESILKIESMAVPIRNRIIATRTQDFFIRYIILEISARAWGAFISIISPLLVFGTNLYLSAPNRLTNQSYLITNLIYTLQSYITSAGYVILFISIGWPLLKDICKAIGITPKEIFSFKKIK